MSPLLDESCFSVGIKEENIEKNRYKDILPLDTCRAYLSTPVKGSNEYINAIFVPVSFILIYLLTVKLKDQNPSHPWVTFVHRFDCTFIIGHALNQRLHQDQYCFKK